MSQGAMQLPEIENEIMDIFSKSLHQELASTEVDLIESGRMDSIVLMELTLALEHRFDLNVPVRDIQIDDLETVKTIAKYVQRLMNSRGLFAQSSN